MTGDLRRGAVVLITTTDPSDGNEKTRPAVVVDINQTQQLLLICASTQFDPANLRDDEFVLPYSSGNSPCLSGLTQPTVAKCRWIRVVPPEAVIRKLGFLKNDLLQALFQKVVSLKKRDL